MSKAVRKEAEARVGTLLRGKWRLERLLDVGGMGAVYAGVHRNGRRVAVKLLHREFAVHASVRDRFEREGRVANRIGHPGALEILDDDVAEDGSLFLVMELLDGVSLGQRLKDVTRLDVAETLRIADDTLDVLVAAHREGIVHRDIKPANLFLTTDGRVKVLDFGLARLRDGNSPITNAGTILGTAAYMSPEQARGKANELDGRADLYSLGAVMFAALTGRHVHPGTMAEQLIAVAMSTAPPLRSVLPDAPELVADVVDMALRSAPDDRWQTALLMQEAVRAARAALPGGLPAGLAKVGARPRTPSQVSIGEAAPSPMAASIHLEAAPSERAQNEKGSPPPAPRTGAVPAASPKPGAAAPEASPSLEFSVLELSLSSLEEVVPGKPAPPPLPTKAAPPAPPATTPRTEGEASIVVDLEDEESPPRSRP